MKLYTRLKQHIVYALTLFLTLTDLRREPFRPLLWRRRENEMPSAGLF
ncbi:MAG: hypothetical protein J7623_22865 [Chitinophaga sp.]|nr:hypothetical protein [Chitinophaga sp.]MBO9731501.1 hypothetical protein [Chitinophaga sp.]